MSDTQQPCDIDLRDAFFDELYEIAKQDKDVVFLTADMGAFSLVRFKKDLPQQYINVGVSEQAMMSVAAGLALEGKKVFVYSIVPFVTLRCYEQIKIDLCCMNLPVTIIGIGAGLMYGGDGPTHHAIHDVAVMRALPGMCIFNPSDATLTQASAQMAYRNACPTYVRIEKGKLPALYDKGENFSAGMKEVRPGKEITIFATGVMVHEALKAAQLLEAQPLSVRVVDVYRMKPIQAEEILSMTEQARLVVTLEENVSIGGLGSVVSEVLVAHSKTVPLRRIDLGDQHCTKVLDRASLHVHYQLDAKSVAAKIKDWFREMG